VAKLPAPVRSLEPAEPPFRVELSGALRARAERVTL
jgi:hypothetical protein